MARHVFLPGQTAPAVPSGIVALAARIKHLLENERRLGEESLARGLNAVESKSLEDEQDLLYDERRILVKQVTLSTPINAPEALIVMMHGVDQVNYGHEFEEGDIVKRGEKAVRRAAVVLARELKFDLTLAGSEKFSPAYLSVQSEGCIEMASPESQRLEELSPEELKICQKLHSLWWKARQRNAARLQAEALREKLSDKEAPL